MRIHTNTLTWEQISSVLSAEKGAGRIARSVTFKTLREHKSATHARAFEVQLESWEKLDGDGRRFGNSGSYGAGENYTATFDEWGWFLSGLYTQEDTITCGSGRNAVYTDAWEFHRKTGDSFNIPEFASWGDDPYPFVQGKNTVGRRGYGRVSEDGTNGNGYHIGYREMDAAIAYYEATPAQRRTMSRPWLKYEPRTRADMLTFAHLTVKELA